MRTCEPHHVSARQVLAGLAAGTLGGLAGAWVMGRFQSLARRAEQRLAEENVEDGASERESATELQASRVAHAGRGRELTIEEKRKAGTAVHYGFGTAVGALYGALSEVVPGLTAWAGLPFGAGLWLTADEVLVPARGLAPPPAEVPAREHGSAFSAHLAYALTAETVRRALRGVPR
jgi:hypothetical protein